MGGIFDLDRIGGEGGLRGLVDVILSAGDWARELQEQGVGEGVERKGDDSPVTIADREVERRLRAFMQSRYPEAGFLGEESGEQTAEADAIRFIVDPIDGTRAFVRGLDTWSVLVGVEWRGMPSVGIAYMPAVEEIFVAYTGGGATLNDAPLQVSSTESLSDALVTHGGLEAFLDDGCEARLLAVARSAYTIRGFADFDGYRRVLTGRADAMVDPGVQPYDICPAAVLLAEAGGRFTDLSGADTIYGGSGLGSNGRIHDEVVATWANASDA